MRTSVAFQIERRLTGAALWVVSFDLSKTVAMTWRLRYTCFEVT